MPDIGMITNALFFKSVERALEYSDKPHFKFCGTGDAVLDKNIVTYAQHIQDAGCDLAITTNGYLLTEEKSKALIDAGVGKVAFSISSRGETYNKEFGLDFEVTHENILKFVELAKGKCEVIVSMVDHDPAVDYKAEEAYWLSKGVNGTIKFKKNSRAGALFIPPPLSEEKIRTTRAAIESSGKIPQCLAPFFYLFIGWDGHYYLCSSDWKKEVNLGHVTTHSVRDTLAGRERAVKSRNPICHRCTIDPINEYISRETQPVTWA